MKTITLAASSMLLGALGCAGESTDADEPSRGIDPIDRIARAPDGEGLARLEEIIASGESGHVRERALLAYGSSREKDAIPLLKSVALADPDDAVAATARAEIERIRNAFPDPPRGWMNVGFPDTFTAGEPFDVTIAFGSEEVVPRVRFELRLPEQIEVVSGAEPRWSGELEAGEQREMTFQLRASGPPRGGVRARLKLDYPEMLDVEVHQERLRVALTGATGRIDRLPAQTDPRSP